MIRLSGFYWTATLALLFSGVGNLAEAGEVAVTGADGAAGAAGVDGDPGGEGGSGGPGEPANATANLLADPENRATAAGGRGGRGGDAGNGLATFPDTSAAGGRGGMGGVGGDAAAFAFTNVTTLAALADAYAVGGFGGNGGRGGAGIGDALHGLGGIGGAGGVGRAHAQALNTDLLDPVNATAFATGGNGGDAFGFGGVGGAGGLGIIDVGGVFAISQFTDAFVDAQQFGGHGGFGFDFADGGRGADSVLVDRVSGESGSLETLYLRQFAQGGDGGGAHGGLVGMAGVGSSSLTLADVNPNEGNAEVIVAGHGGWGGKAESLSDGGIGALGSADADITGHSPNLRVVVQAAGGKGGDSEFRQAGDGGLGSLGPISVVNTYGFGDATLETIVYGGSGGSSTSLGDGGDGAHTYLENEFTAIEGYTLTLRQNAIAGNGGGSVFGTPGAAGWADSTLGNYNDRLPLAFDVYAGVTAETYAAAGHGGQKGAGEGIGTDGGNAWAYSDLRNESGSLSITATSRAGDGGKGLGVATSGGHGGLSRANAYGAIGDSVNEDGTAELTVMADALGGRGGDAMQSGLAGRGGDAIVEAVGRSPASTMEIYEGVGGVSVNGLAVGGDGGMFFGDGAIGIELAGAAGDATSNVHGFVDGDAAASAWAEAYGGMGGSRDPNSGSGNGGLGGDAYASAELELVNSIGQSASVASYAIGGAGGAGRGNGYRGGLGGIASVSSVKGIVSGDALIDISASAQATGGKGGDGLAGARGGLGGDSNLASVVEAAGRFAAIHQTAVGGEGGSSSGAQAGRGGNAESTYDGFARGHQMSNVVLFIEATGGQGGLGLSSGNGGNGGDASGGVSFLNEFEGDNSIWATATGGRGGDSTGGQAGHGGQATLSNAFATSTTTFPVEIHGQAFGGRGGDGFYDSAAGRSGIGGNGASIALTDAVNGNSSGQVLLFQEVAGGDAGSGDERGSAPGLAGNAESRFISLPISGFAIARGGVGGARYLTGRASDGGNALAFGSAFAISPSPLRDLTAHGGKGGTGYNGARAGNGGHGEARGTVDGFASSVNATTSGGAGGDVVGLTGADGARGGDALAVAEATSNGDLEEEGAISSAISLGGQGSTIVNGRGIPGAGGDAVSLATATARDSNVLATASATAGRGGFPGLVEGNSQREGRPGTALATATASGALATAITKATVGVDLITSFRGTARGDARDSTVITEARAHAFRNPDLPVNGDIPFVSVAALPSDGMLASARQQISAYQLESDGQFNGRVDAELNIWLNDLTPQERSEHLVSTFYVESFSPTIADPQGDYFEGNLFIGLTRQGATIFQFNQLNPSIESINELIHERMIDLGNTVTAGSSLRLNLTMVLFAQNPETSFVLNWGVQGPDARRALVNGDFAFGGVGWEASGQNSGGNPVATPHITFPALPDGNRVGRFKTGEYADDILLSTLRRELVVDAEEPFLTFDFTLADVVEDLTGAGGSPLTDRVEVLVEHGMERFLLLTIDRFGAFADPSGTAPGETLLGLPSDAAFDHQLIADLSSLAGEELSLIINVINENDGLRLDPDLDNFRMTAVPEPSTLALAVTAALWGLVRRRLRAE